MKNKEIEELLNELKDVAKRHTIEIREYGFVETMPQSISKELRLNSYSANLLLSYIEQLETDYKEANESVTWWGNRYNAVERDNRKLKNNRDKAIEILERHTRFSIEELLNILKGDSDE